MNIANIDAIMGILKGPAVKNTRVKADLVATKPNNEPQQPSKPSLGVEEFQKMIDNINKMLSGSNLSMQYTIDESTDTMVFRLIDDSGQVVRQIPPDEILKLKAYFKEVSGLLFEKAV